MKGLLTRKERKQTFGALMYECWGPSVGDMQQLLAWCRLSNMDTNVRNLLGMPRRFWNELGNVAMNARDNDNYIRMWYSSSRPDQGLMFACQRGTIKIASPLGD